MAMLIQSGRLVEITVDGLGIWFYTTTEKKIERMAKVATVEVYAGYPECAFKWILEDGSELTFLESIDLLLGVVVMDNMLDKLPHLPKENDPTVKAILKSANKGLEW